MDDTLVVVTSWDVGANDRLANTFRAWKYPHVETVCDKTNHESVTLNKIIRGARDRGFKYLALADADIRYDHEQTIRLMRDYLESHPASGVIRPWCQGENAGSNHDVTEKYIEDGTGWVFRLDMGGWTPTFDEEFLGTGWSDMDIGMEIAHRGFKTMHDRRYPVFHKAGGTTKNPFITAVGKRNKLILDFKWHKVGRDRWQGVEWYNSTVPDDEKIPTFFELMSWRTDDLERFQQSISPEHAQIFKKDVRENPNLIWHNPLLVGYSTREKFHTEHGYS